MVVRMYRLLRSHCAAQDLNRSIGDDLVRVHIGLGAGAGLPDYERKMVDEFEGRDF